MYKNKVREEDFRIKKFGKYELYFKTFWLAIERPIGFINFIMFVFYLQITLGSLLITLLSVESILGTAELKILLIGIGAMAVGLSVNLGMHRYIKWFHEKGIYKYIIRDRKHYKGTFLNSLNKL